MKPRADQPTLAILGGPKAVSNPPVERWRKIDQRVKEAVNRLMDADVSTIPDAGGVIHEFEQAFAALTGSRYALAMNSGTATLHSAYVAAGIGPGDEVLVPTYTWHATITPVLHCAATPVFVDLDPATLTISPDDIERKLTRRTKALSIVHVWGNVCNMDRILAIVKRHGLVLIEDCSHAHGASWQGRPVGSMGAIGCFSLQGPKAVSGGEAGVAVTDDPELCDRMILLGHFGRKRVGTNQAIHHIGDMSLGAKYRAHAWAIAMANEDLKRLPELNAKRTRNYQVLNDGLRGCPGLELIEPLPGVQRAGYLEFKFKLTRDVLKRVSRERIVAAIQAEGVPLDADRYSSYNYTYGLLHTAPLFTEFDRRSIGGCFYDPEADAAPRPVVGLPAAEDVAGRLVGTPAYADTDEESLHQMAAGIRKVMDQVDRLG
ncbi:DegT/DnrJ/EryC1/StrS family aminotransferase [bacterium]|nr:DegT/DnrJ/EryC1/StrS family aminotransferase [bacterium]